MNDETETKEIWRPVVGYEATHSVSNMGRVRSEPRTFTRSNGRRFTVQGQVMAPGIGKNGYPTVSLRVPGHALTHYVHHLVLRAFVGPCPEGMECLHLNHIRTDARLMNLRWGTHQENADQLRDDGRGQAALGADTAQKLDWADTHLILARLAAGETHQAIADRFGVGRQCIGGIARGECWREHQSRQPEPEPGWFLGKPADMSPSAIEERRAAFNERRAAA